MAERRELDWSGLRLTSFEPVAAAAVAVEKKGDANALGDPATVQVRKEASVEEREREGGRE